jgi:hypothetical protein
MEWVVGLSFMGCDKVGNMYIIVFVSRYTSTMDFLVGSAWGFLGLSFMSSVFPLDSRAMAFCW